MRISIDITNVDVAKLTEDGILVKEFMPKLEEVGVEDYDIVYSHDGENGMSMVIKMVFVDSKPTDPKVFIDILDEMEKYFSNDLLENGNIESLNK